jgi:putative alpha-1,2-mannosidase
VNNGFWDTYRTVWPAYSLFSQDDAAALVNGFVQQYKDGGWISRWSSPGYANLMVGTSSDVAFADAYLKGIKGIDIEAAYDAAVKNATVVPPSQNVGRKGMDLATFNGYTANTTAEGFSWSMDGYINDFGIANLSKALYDKAKKNDPRKQEYLDNYKYFLNRARNYVTLFDPAVDFFQGKGPDGVWGSSPSTFDPQDWGHDYTETNAWNMAFSAVRRPRRAGEEARRVLQYAGGRAAHRWVRQHDPRDARGPRRPDGSVRPQQPAVAPHHLHVRRGRPAVEDTGEGARGAVTALHRLGDRAGVPR